MAIVNKIGNIIGGGGVKQFPENLYPTIHIPDFSQVVNGYFVNKANGKKIQAATTTTANDSLIMPANDADIIAAVTLAGQYSKFYTNNSTPKTVLISQIPSIDQKYCLFFDSVNSKNFILFKTQGTEINADLLYNYCFKTYIGGGYFPITQTADSISFVIRGTGTFVFNWGDGSNTSATYRDWETDRKSTRLNSSHSAKSRMPSSA